MSQARIPVQVGPGIFSTERSVWFRVADKVYNLLVDKGDVDESGSSLAVYVVAREGDRAMIDLPQDTTTSGRRIIVPTSLLLPACSSDPDPEPAKVCAPGQQIECACPGSTTKGAQVCKSDGSGFDACLPCAIGGGGAGGGAGSGGTGGADRWSAAKRGRRARPIALVVRDSNARATAGAFRSFGRRTRS